MKVRYTLPDLLRGILIVSMVLYHAMWDLVYIFSVEIPWFRPGAGGGTAFWQAATAWAFILLSGFCWSMGRHRLRRAISVLVCSAAVSAATLMFLPVSAIRFGVLSLIGSAMLLTIPLDRFFGKISPYVGLMASCLLFGLTRHVCEGYLGCGDWVLPLPAAWYANDLTAYLGLRPEGFFSTDYVPLLPWLFLYWAGYFGYRIFRRRGWLRHLSAVSRPLPEWLGRHSLVIYMVHQPLIYGALTIFL